MIKVPTFITNFLIKICCYSKLKKIKRKMLALIQNNEFSINNTLENYTKFEEYELKEEE